MGVQAAVRQGTGVPRLPRAAVLPEGPDPAERPRAAHGRRRLPGSSGHHRVRGREAARRGRRLRRVLDHHPVDRPDQLRHRGRRRHRLRRGAPDRRQVRRQEVLPRQAAARLLRQGARRELRSGPRAQGLRDGRLALLPGVPVLRRRQERRRRPGSGTGRLPDLHRRLRRHRRGHRPGAPGSLRRGRYEHAQRQGHQERGRARRGLQVHIAVPRLRGHVRVRREQADSAQPARRRRPAGPHPRGAARHPLPGEELRALLPALLALRHPADLQAGELLVRVRHQDQGPSARAQPADQLDSGQREGRPVRQVARQRPRLVHLPQPLLGIPDSGVGVRRPEVPARRRVRFAGGAQARLRRLPARPRGQHQHAPPVHRRADPRQPGRSDRQEPHAPHLRRDGLLVRIRFDELRAVPLPVREQGNLRTALPVRLHRGIHRPDPRLVLRAAHHGHRPVRQAGVQERDLPRHRARLRRPEDVEAPAQLPGRERRVRQVRLRRHALVPDELADPARRQPHRHRRRHPRHRPPDHAAGVELLLLLHPVRQRGEQGRRLRRPRAARRRSGLAAGDGPLPAGPHPPSDPEDRVRTRPVPDLRRLRRGLRLHRHAHQLVHPQHPRPFLERGRERVQHAVHRARGIHARHGAARPDGGRSRMARSDRRRIRASGRLAVPEGREDRRRHRARPRARRRSGSGRRDGEGA